MTICLSIDPGINSTGLCLWIDGRVQDITTIKAPAATRKMNIVYRACHILDGLCQFMADNQVSQVSVTAIEDFQGHTNKPNMLNMMKCCVIQGALIADATRFSGKVIPVNKRNEPKEVARYAALDFGLTDVDEHAADAFRIGQIAGFDRHEKG